jgi:hypothetical protein
MTVEIGVNCGARGRRLEGAALPKRTAAGGSGGVDRGACLAAPLNVASYRKIL